MRKWLIAATLLGLSSAISAQSDDVPGSWVQAGKFLPVNAACSQRWICVPDQAQIYSADLRLSGPAPKATLGVCSAGGGDITSCNYCLASVPEEPCVLKLEKR